MEQLVGATLEGFAGWLAEQSALPVPRDRATALATIGLGALFSARLLENVLGVAAKVDDDTLIRTWVPMMVDAITAERH